MSSLSSRVLVLFLLAFVLGPGAFAHDVAITGSQSFASLDGSASDHDGAVNGVFTVNDGNLAVNGVVNCNDDGPGGNSACAMAFAVSGDLSVNAGGALYAENRNGPGNGGAITLTVGGNLSLNGNAIISSASTSNPATSNGGAINATVGGAISAGAGSTIDSGAGGGTAGSIALVAGGVATIDGSVLAGPSRTLAATRLTGVALAGGGGSQKGGPISVTSSTFAEPALIVGATGNVVSQGQTAAGAVTLDGCGLDVRGLVASLSRDSSAVVTLRSGKSVTVDGRDLGGAGLRMGRVRADALTGTAAANRVDVFAADSVTILGPAAGLYGVSSNAGSNDPKGEGGSVRAIALAGSVAASGNAIDAGGSNAGNGGGSIALHSAADALLNAASLRAAGDHTSNNNNRDGGVVTVRSYSGNVIWTNGVGDVRPLGSASSIPLADQGSISLTACGTVNTTGSSFPVNGTATSVHPQTQTGVCSPNAPSLPAGTPALITCNTPPVANDTSATTNEDNTVTLTLSGTDADGDSLTFTIVSSPSNGVLGAVISTGPTTATVDYTPNANYFGADSFVYQANDGNGGTDSANANITVNAVNDPPTFLAGPTVTVLEDAGPQTYANWATGITAGPGNESGQTVTFTVTNDNPSLFTAGGQPALSSNGTLTFTSAANAFGSANITVVAQDDGGIANGGDDTSNPQTSSITVTAVNDAPSFTKGANQTVGEDAGPQTVAGWATGISAGPNEGSQAVSFVSANDNNALFSAQPAVSSTGTLTYTPAADANGSATVTVYAQDDGGTANGGVDTSAPQTFTITVSSVNDAPSFTGGGDVTVLEDSGAYSAAWATAISAGPADESSQTVTFSASNDNNTLFSAQPSISASGVLSFALNANAFGSATVSVTLSDDGGTANGGADTSASQTFTISVGGVNDEPTFTPGANQTSNEDAGPQTVSAWATSIDAGPGESGQTVSFVTSNDNPALFSAQPSVAPDGTLTYTAGANANGSATVTVYAQDNGGTANGGDDTSASYTFTITVVAVNDAPSFTGGGDVSVLEDSSAYSSPWATAISAGPADESGQTLTFNVTSTNPSLFASGPSISASGVLSFTLNANAFGSSTVTVTLSDDGGTANGGANTSAAQTFTINVGAVNDAPSFTGGGDVTVNEDSGPYAAPWASGISAGPGESGQSVSFNVSNNNNALFLVQPSISSTGVLTFTTALNAFGSALVTVTLSDNGGTANGGVDTSAPQTFTINVTAVNDGPTANNDSWQTLGNTELRVDLPAGITPNVADTTPSGNGVRDNDSDPEGDPIVVTGVVGCPDTTAPFDCTISGAKISMLANGSFSYTPAPGATSGSFQYTATDVPAFGSPVTTTATVNIAIFDMIWYVNGSVAAGGNGTSNAPFAGFASLNGTSDVDAPGHTIFVHSSAVAGSIDLEASQLLWGEGIGLSKPNNLNGNGSPTVLVAPGVAPVVTSAGDVVTVHAVSGTEIAGLTLNSAGGNAIDVTSGPFETAAGATIYNNNIVGAGLEGIDVNAGSPGANVVLINNTSISSTGVGLEVSSIGQLTFAYSNGTVTSSAASGVVIDGSAGDLTITGLSNLTVHGNTAGDGLTITDATFDAVPGGSVDTVITGSMDVGSAANPVGGAGVVLSNVSGALNIGHWTVHAGTSGVTVAGDPAGMTLSNSSGVITAPAGVGLSVIDTTIASGNLNFTSISSTGGTNGIRLSNTGSGSLVVSGAGSAGSGGTISGTSGRGVDLTSTGPVSLSWMSIQNSGNDGIGGSNVGGLSLTSTTLSNNGNAVGESGLDVTNLTGTSIITASTFTGSAENNFSVGNNTGSGTITITNSTFSANSSVTGNDGLFVMIDAAAALNVSVTGSTFTNNRGDHFQAATSSTATGTMSLVFKNNTLTGASGNLGAGITISTAGSSVVGYDISNNTVLKAFSTAINVNLGASTSAARLAGTISSNTIGDPAIANSGSASGDGINVTSGGSGISTVTVTNNLIRQYANLAGINMLQREGNGALNATVSGNTISNPGSFATNAILVNAGAIATDNGTVCANITGNNITGAGAGGATDFRLRQRFLTTVRLPGYAGANNNTAAVVTFVSGNNGGASGSATQNVAGGGGGFVGGAACPTP